MSDNNIIDIIKNAWRINRFGSGVFIIGMTLFIIGVLYSIIRKVNINSSPENEIKYAITTIGIGIPFILTGINIILNPIKRNIKLILRDYFDDISDYIKDNKILVAGFIISIISTIFLFISFPRGIYQTYTLFILYNTGIILLISHTFSNIIYSREKLEKCYIIIKQKKEMIKEEIIPEYITEFANNIKKDIDIATSTLSEMTILSINKYKSDNQQLHNDVQNFKRRLEKEKDDYKKYANERIIKNLTKMFTNIDYALKYKDNKDINGLTNDIEIIKKDLNNILTEEEIEIINPAIGEDFDDTTCCAVNIIDTDKFQDNKVMEVKKIGYKFKSGKIICADVTVSKNNGKNNGKKLDEIKNNEKNN